jgi:proteasome beta subunit
VPTVVAFECDGGAVVAADRAVVRENRLVGERARLRAVDGYAAAVLDDAETVLRRFESELRGHRTDRGDPSLSAATRLLAAALEGVTDGVLAARDGDGVARVRLVTADGGSLTDDCHALGSGADLALGGLGASDRDVPPEAAADLARETLATVAERDPATGDAVDVATVESDAARDASDT